MLINQVYRFSVDDIALRYREAYGANAADKVRNLRIVDKEAAAFIDPELHASCASLSRLDDQTSRPLEFHPRYMHCLIAYGRHFADTRSQVLTGGDLSLPALPMTPASASRPRLSPPNG